MKIAIDVSNMNAMSRKRGIGFYVENLVSSLRKYTRNDIYLVEEPEDMSKFALIHYPYFDFFNLTLKIDGKVPSVVTVHDVTPLIFPQHYPPGIKGKIKNYIQRKNLEKIDAIITDSASAKEDIVKYLGIESSKIHVVYLSAADKFRKLRDSGLLKKVRERYKLPEKFILFTGSTNWNKNLLNLVQAAVEAQTDIVFAGKAFENRENLDHPELSSFREFLGKFGNHPLVHILGFVSDDDIVPLYNLAEALALPSFYEGFGLPILEAQKCGVPVIAGKNSSMVEVAGEGAILVDPNSVEDIKNAILKIRSKKKVRESLIEKGFENEKRFSPESTAEKTNQVYEMLIGK